MRSAPSVSRIIPTILLKLRHQRSKHLVGLLAILVVTIAAMASLTSAKSAGRMLLSTVVDSVLASDSSRSAPARERTQKLGVPGLRNWKHSVSPLFPIQESEPVVTTDKLDYQPGEIVLISGSGFWPNEIVTLLVEHTDGTLEGGAGHEPWTVTADNFGQFYSSWFVDPNDSFGSSFVLTAVGASSNLSTLTFFTDAANPAADLDQCANGPASAPVQCTGSNWQNGNLNQNQAHYGEGDSVPYRMRFSNLDTTISHTVTIEWDTTQSGKHALDYLTSFDRTETTANPCSGVMGCVLAGPKDLEAIPVDDNVTRGQNGIDDPPPGPTGGDDITQIAGNFTLFNGTITGVSAYTLDGTYAGNSSTSITITFTTTVSNPVMAWGGHIGTRIDWGLANSAIAIPGSPYHMRLIDLDGRGGNQDRSLSASAVFFPVKLTIIKETNPDNAAVKTFDYTVTGTNLSPFSLTPPDGTTSDMIMFSLTDDSTRTITESDPAAASPKFDLTSLSCVQMDGGLGTGTVNTNLGTRTVSLTPKEGQSIACTFVNTQRGKIIVEKQTNPDGAMGSFTFTGDAAGTISDNGMLMVADLAPGTYTSTENDPTPAFDLTAISCDDGMSATPSSGNVMTRTATFNVDPGETVKCTFTNTQRGKIIVEKQTNPDGAMGMFTFTGHAAGTIADNGMLMVGNLVPGTYTSTENDPTPAFDLTAISCDDGMSATPSSGNVMTRTATFKVDPGETVKCTFTNTQRGMVDVLKITNGAAHPELDIKFTLYRDGPDVDPDLTGTDVQLEELSTLNDADGLLEFTEKLVPGTTYTICENPVPAGWTSLWMITFSVGGSIVTPYNPNANDMPPQDMGIRCFDFTVNPGETKHFEVHNDFPGGDPRTIGYWKNWNTCTGGGQAMTAAANGGAAAGFFLLDDLLPQLIGDFNVNTCQKGVNILNKQDQNGRNKANDAAYELAAQLLAAKLNLGAGAETCPAVQMAVINGQNLLANNPVNFTGSGDYLGPKAKNLASLRAQALSLAATLDQYNNGNLCP